MCKNSGFFGSFVRLVLAGVNLLFLLLGISTFGVAAFIRWSPNTLLNIIAQNDIVESIVNISSINSISIALLVIGGMIVILSSFGLIGAICGNRFFLIVYEFFMIILFIGHTVALIAITLKSGDIESEFSKSLNSTVSIINDPNTTEDKFKNECNIMKSLSLLFDCCGAESPLDFNKQSFIDECCMPKKVLGCLSD